MQALVMISTKERFSQCSVLPLYAAAQENRGCRELVSRSRDAMITPEVKCSSFIRTITFLRGSLALVCSCMTVSAACTAMQSCYSTVESS